MKKVIITVVGSALILAGLVFVVVPGPAFLLIVPGLMLLSFEYPIARVWLKKVQRLMRKSANAIDKYLLKRKYSR